MGVVEAERISR